jgi:ligand-binding sensor domain-containing protein
MSCNGQVQTNPPKAPIKDQGLGLPIAPSDMQASLEAGIDPYFVETNDTFSTRGPQCIVRNLIQDKAGNIWLASWHGIIKYDGKVFTNYTLKEKLIHFHVTTLFEDSKENIWFALARGGVYRYDGRSFTLFTTKDGLAHNTTNCIAEDKNGNIWFGTENGASRFDGKTFSNYTTQDGLSHNYITAVIRDKTGLIWLGTSNGINRYDGKSFTNFTGNDGVPFQRVASLFEDKDGNIWIGSNAKDFEGKGLCRFDPSGKTMTESITPNFVMYMCQDKNGNMWWAHNLGALNTFFSLYRYDPSAAPNTGTKTIAQIVEQDRLDNPAIFGIMEDDDGNIWFGTAKGVCRYNGKSFNYFKD